MTTQADDSRTFRPDGNQTADSALQILRVLEAVLDRDIPGQILEVGCNAGHTSVMLADMIIRKDKQRELHLFDSFEGLPAPTEEDAGGFLAEGDLKVDAKVIEETFAAAGMRDLYWNWFLSKTVTATELPLSLFIHHGWVAETIPRELGNVAENVVAFCLLDLDFYEPTLHCLNEIFPRLAVDGVIIVHDTNLHTNGVPKLPGIEKAINVFRSRFGDLARVDQLGSDSVAITRNITQYEFVQPPVVTNFESDEPVIRVVAENRKLSVCFATFPYGGNGGIPSTCPQVERWLHRCMLKAERDERVGNFYDWSKADTPITMTRNAAVWSARSQKIDVLVMVDSDMWPDMELDAHADTSQKPFWDEAFNFLYAHYDMGPVAVAAPYCGPPPYEMPYVFHWGNEESNNPGLGFSIKAYTREHAAIMEGIQPVAALPTGVIMFDMRVFELTKPCHEDFGDRLKQWLKPYEGQSLTPELLSQLADRCEYEKLRDSHSWFYYEYNQDPDGKCYEYEKGSTEDVTATRDISLAGIATLGYNPVFCAWSSWAGHAKLKWVGKPRVLTADDVATKYEAAVRTGHRRDERIVDAATLIGNVEA